MIHNGSQFTCRYWNKDWHCNHQWNMPYYFGMMDCKRWNSFHRLKMNCFLFIPEVENLTLRRFVPDLYIL